MDKYFDQYVANFDFDKSFDVDQYAVPIACDMIKSYQPDLLLTHIILLDGYRHKTGNDSPYVKTALTAIDANIQRIITASKEAGTYENTNFIIVGDHGQIDVAHEFQLNIPFVEAGLILLESDILVNDYQAYSFSAGYSSQIMLKEPEDQATKERVYMLLKKLQEDYPDYIEAIYTEEESKAQGLTGPFTFVVEGTKGTIFGTKYTGDLIQHVNDPDYKNYKSNHGYHPCKGPKPLLIAFGPNIEEGKVLEHASVLNECPTFCKLLNIQMPSAKEPHLDILKNIK